MISHKINPSELSQNYKNASPFPHIVLEDMFDSGFVVYSEHAFPPDESIHFGSQDPTNPREVKKSVQKPYLLEEPLLCCIEALNSPKMLEFLEQLTGIQGLIGDPYFSGGGPHLILPGGKLALHIDFNKHPKLKLYRRINLLLYLNRKWEDDYGGNLELWDHDTMSGKPTFCVKDIQPTYGRVVIFNTSGRSFHGHPKPLKEGVTRRSIAMYYYTAEPPSKERKSFHNTLFYDGLGKSMGTWKDKLMNRWMPPVCADWIRSNL